MYSFKLQNRNNENIIAEEAEIRFQLICILPFPVIWPSPCCSDSHWIKAVVFYSSDYRFVNTCGIFQVIFVYFSRHRNYHQLSLGLFLESKWNYMLAQWISTKCKMDKIHVCCWDSANSWEDLKHSQQNLVCFGFGFGFGFLFFLIGCWEREVVKTESFTTWAIMMVTFRLTISKGK